jgi:hypothetical protein
MGFILFLVRSTWAVSYAAFSLTSFILTGFAIFGERTPNRVANIVLSLTSNQYSEFPLILFFLDLIFQSWLSVTGTFRKFIFTPRGKELQKKSSHGSSDKDNV